MFKNRLFLQMFLTAGFAAAAAVSVIFVSVQFQFEKALHQKAADSLQIQMVFAEAVAKDFLVDGLSTGTGGWQKNVQGTATRLSIISTNGVVLFDSSKPVAELDNHRSRPELLEAAAQGDGSAIRYSNSVDTELLYIARRIDDDTGMPMGYVRLSSAISLISNKMAELQNQLLGVIFVTLTGVFFASFLLSRRFYRPIAAASFHAREIAEGNYQLRSPGRSNDEVGVLERSLNELARKTEGRLERIVENRNQLEAILSGLNEGVVALDKDETIAHINKSAIHLLDIEGPVLGKKVWEAIRISKIQYLLEAALENRLETDRMIGINGRMLELSIETLTSDTGSHEGVILVFQDATERLKLDKVRTDFVANASHELKTPLAAIKGVIETVIDDPEMPSDVAQNFFHRILAQSDRLNKIVQELMQLSRFENFRDEISEKQQVNFVSIVAQVYESLQSTAQAKSVDLALEATNETVPVFGDQEALSQLVSNLVENAIKYSPENSRVRLMVKREGDDAIAEIEDNGIGISEEAQKRIFERFYRVDAARSRALGGTGLGLSIVKHIADAHNGRVQVESELGQGSKFTVRLPLGLK